MKKAVIYARYSNSYGAHSYIQKQIKICQDYADAHSIEIEAVYSDIGSALKKRFGFDHMLKEAEQRDWNYIIVYTQDRLAVTIETLVKECQVLANKNIEVICIKENLKINIKDYLEAPFITFGALLPKKGD